MGTSVVGVVGAGAMGRGIVQVLLQTGHEVYWLDSCSGATDQARATLQKIWQRMAEKGKCTSSDIEHWLGRMQLISELNEFAGCECLIEAIIESESEKRELFQTLESVVERETILASNTSSLSITRLAASLRHPERFAGFHCFNPVPLMPLVEVIAGLRTRPEVIHTLEALAQVMGMTAIRVSDTPGFLVNQVGRAYPIESAHLVSEGVASPFEVDCILKEQAGFKMGPFELMDLTGLDVTQPVTEILFREHFCEPRYRPSVMMGLRRHAGLLGRKTSQGFYAYKEGEGAQLSCAKGSISSPADSDVAGSLPARVWIAAEDVPGREWLERLISQSGVPLDQGNQPSDDALVLLAPLGNDATEMVTRLGLPGARSIAVDTLMPLDRRRVIMPCLLAEPPAVAQALKLVGAGGVPVSLIQESTGFVSQRVLALMVNQACELAQQGVATPQDIDRATRLALGYPQGPLEWGNQLGAERLLRILNSVFVLTGDSRYRSSAWLRRRAQMSLSLLTEEPRRHAWQD